MSRYICKGCMCECRAIIDKACDVKPTACLYEDVAKNYTPLWEEEMYEKICDKTE